ncbi:MAG: class IV adenylate cyclase [Candidatus Diapherotrites archaeon]
MLETEIKFKVGSPAKMRKKLKGIRAKRVGKRLEQGFIFDDQKDSLKARGILLRLRKREYNLLTLKIPSRNASRKFKVRKEIEVKVSDFSEMKALLEAMGFKVKHRYEKIRESFVFRETRIELDKLPFLGYYLEIEGKQKGIQETAKKLGLSLRDGITKNYLQIAREFFGKRREDYIELLFSLEKR